VTRASRYSTARALHTSADEPTLLDCILYISFSGGGRKPGSCPALPGPARPNRASLGTVGSQPSRDEPWGRPRGRRRRGGRGVGVGVGVVGGGGRARRAAEGARDVVAKPAAGAGAVEDVRAAAGVCVCVRE
jgi:hypothetical protein